MKTKPAPTPIPHALYRATVYHGGSLLGLGRWATGREWPSYIEARLDGERLAEDARLTVGGHPTVEVEEIQTAPVQREKEGEK